MSVNRFGVHVLQMLFQCTNKMLFHIALSFTCHTQSADNHKKTHISACWCWTRPLRMLFRTWSGEDPSYPQNVTKSFSEVRCGVGGLRTKAKTGNSSRTYHPSWAGATHRCVRLPVRGSVSSPVRLFSKILTREFRSPSVEKEALLFRSSLSRVSSPRTSVTTSYASRGLHFRDCSCLTRALLSVSFALPQEELKVASGVATASPFETGCVWQMVCNSSKVNILPTWLSWSLWHFDCSWKKPSSCQKAACSSTPSLPCVACHGLEVRGVSRVPFCLCSGVRHNSVK